MIVGSTISHYKIVEKLGEGGMGVVYKAEDTTLERSVALKFLADHLLNDEEAKARFLREAKAAAALHHPNVCPVYEIAEVDGKTFLAMAFLQGETLEDRIDKGPLPIEDALDIAHHVAEGLQAAHREGVVHRDIKPANILVSPEGRATIMDFGLARLTEASKLTRADQTMGTAAYMSPEQIQGAEIDHRTDLWALGCVVYEMVAGRRPFQGEYDQALSYEIVQQEPAALTGLRTGVPIELELLTAKCLAKATEDRYQSATEVGVDLRTLAEKLKSGRSTFMRPTHSAAAASGDVGPTQSRSRGSPTEPVVQPEQKLIWLQGLAVALAGTLLSVSYAYFSAGEPEKEVRQFSLETPPNLRDDPSNAVIAISPNGRYIAYTTAGPEGQLYVHDLSEDEPHALENTEGALHPFWSPDSELIGFFVDGGLNEVSVRAALPARSGHCGLLSFSRVRGAHQANRSSLARSWDQGRTCMR